MAEHARIARFFAPLAAGEPGSFSLTDDAALLQPPHPFVVTTDSVIVGTHVLPDATPQQVAEKLLRRNLSDLAAMGATPWRYFLNLHTPTGTNDDWFAAFTAQLALLQTQFGLVLAGGDSTSGAGPIHATLTCLGLADGPVLRRHGAQPGDDVYMSGTLGDAALGLAVLQEKLTLPAEDHAFLAQRYHLPEPRLALGAMLRSIATSCIDISDGLLADAGQLAQASGVQLQLTRSTVPLSPAAQHALQLSPDVWAQLLTGGDDYELLFTAPVAARAALGKAAVTRIGVVAEGSGVLLDGQPAQGGWQHR